MADRPVEPRFENHKHGCKATWTAKIYGLGVLPELYGHLHPMAYGAAVWRERNLTKIWGLRDTRRRVGRAVRPIAHPNDWWVPWRK